MMVVGFNEVGKNDVAAAGGKGANLGEMISAGIPVPRGFIVTADAYRLFIKENGYEDKFEQILSKADDAEKLSYAAEELRKLILEGKLSEAVVREVKEKYSGLGKDVRVAVRSSATAEDLPDASFAGQQETYLNVMGIDSVLTQIKKCYASLWGNRAVSYRFHQGYDQMSVALAVVVQEMVESEKAGVLFTVNPVNKNSDEMQINASYGLGESVVSGRVTADSILCSKDGAVISYQTGSKQTEIKYGSDGTEEVSVSEERRQSRCLSNEEISGLCRAGRNIEEHYGFPMDIEWAVRDGKIYILQARAITTLKESESDEKEAELIRQYLKDSKISGMAKENMAFQLEKMPYAYRPLDYDLIMKINDQKSIIFAEAGINLTSNPQMDDDGIMTLPDPKKGLTKKLVNLPKIIKTIKDYDLCAEKCREFMPKYEAELKKVSETDFDKMSVDECGTFLSEAYELLGSLCYDRFKYALFPSALSQHLTKAVKKIDKKYTNYDLYKGLNNKTSVITREVAALAEKIREDKKLTDAVLSGMKFDDVCKEYPNVKPVFDSFIKRNGFKSDFNCYCVEARTLREDPDRLLNILRPLLQSEGLNEEEDSGDEFKKMMYALYKIYGKKYEKLRADIKNFRYFHVVREESQYLWETLFYYIRRCLKRVNSILLGNDDYVTGVSNLFISELIKACQEGELSDKNRERINRRNDKHPLSQKVWDASKLLVFDSKGDILKGVSGSTGIAVGTVCIVHSPAEFSKMKQGDILVCELTDPEWTPLFKLASAVVADTGSSLSHAAIVAREFGIPAVLGVGFATTRFKDGDTIRVDGDMGEVSVC